MEIRGANGGVGRVDTRNTGANVAQNVQAKNVSHGAKHEVHTKSKELLRLAEGLQRVAEVRDSEVARVSKTLADGGYDTRDAVVKTADAILRSN